MTFITAENQTVDRALLVLYLNTGSADATEWSPVGKRVEDSSMEMDWQRESKKDVLGNTYSTMKKPIVTQSFDPWELSNGDKAQLAKRRPKPEQELTPLFRSTKRSTERM